MSRNEPTSPAEIPSKGMRGEQRRVLPFQSRSMSLIFRDVAGNVENVFEIKLKRKNKPDGKAYEMRGYQPMLSESNATNLLRIFDTRFDIKTGTVSIFMDSIAGGTMWSLLDKHIQAMEPIAEKQIIAWGKQMFAALSIVEGLGFSHGNIALNNIFFKDDNNEHLKLGLQRIGIDGYSVLAPAQGLNSDLKAVGCVLSALMLLDTLPYDEEMLIAMKGPLENKGYSAPLIDAVIALSKGSFDSIAKALAVFDALSGTR